METVMRQIDCLPAYAGSPPVILAALQKSGDDPTCHHYRIIEDHGTSMTIDGLELILKDDESTSDGDSGDGITLESILAICGDHARQSASSDNKMALIHLRVMAAMRVLTMEQQDVH